MKKITHTLNICIVVLSLVFSCTPDNTTPPVGAEKIETFLDGATVSAKYSTNIIAKEYPLAAQTGFECFFQITSERTNGETFQLNFGYTTLGNCPFTIVTPFTDTLTGNQISVLQIQNSNIDYANPLNNIAVNYNAFGSNTGDPIKITFSGTYYDNLAVSHTIIGEIDILRD